MHPPTPVLQLTTILFHACYLISHGTTQYEPLAPLLRTYPAQSGPLFHAYTDLTHVARWAGVQGVDLGSASEEAGGSAGYKVGATSTAGSGWGALVGRRPDGVSLRSS